MEAPKIATSTTDREAPIRENDRKDMDDAMCE
jgi:hypothetical protein